MPYCPQADSFPSLPVLLAFRHLNKIPPNVILSPASRPNAFAREQGYGDPDQDKARQPRRGQVLPEDEHCQRELQRRREILEHPDGGEFELARREGEEQQRHCRQRAGQHQKKRLDRISVEIGHGPGPKPRNIGQRQRQQEQGFHQQPGR